MKYIIEGDCNGVKYWLNVDILERGRTPDFHWNGLINNATVIDGFDLAAIIFNEVKPYCKIPMQIKPNIN